MIGDRVGNWIIDKELGQGGMGKVYLAHQDAPGEARPKLAAIKFLAAELAREPDFVTRFEREIESLRTLKHPNIVEFYESGRYDGVAYYAMEYVDGPSVEHMVLTRGRLSWQEVVEIVLQVCPALKLAHDHGIIHRDLKPPNLLVRNDGVVKLTDFGVAKIFATQRLTATRAVVGTAEFMSPEQAAGKPITNRSDLYSLGVLMYVLVTGRPLFKAESLIDMLHKHRYARFDPPRAIVPEIPADLDRLICQLLEKDPDQRPRDASVLSKQLEVIRRKEALKEEGKLDEASFAAGETVAAPDSKTRGGPQPAGPATIMSRLMRSQLREMQRPGPIARLFNQPVVIVALLAGVIALLAWGLWPAGPERLLHKAERQLGDGFWDQAADTLDVLDRTHPDHALADQAAALRGRIEESRVAQQARRTAAGPTGFRRPASEGERFYLEAVEDYRAGRIEPARAKWRALIDAFDGVTGEGTWVLLARDALKQADKTDLAAADQAVEQALKEKGKARTRRLKALLHLYADAADPAAKALRARIEKALKDPVAEN